MRRAALIALGAALICAPAASGEVSRPARPAATSAPARLLVEAREFNLTLSRARIKHGLAIVQLADRGEDPHDLAIKRIGGKLRGRIAKTLPGEVGEWEGRLRRGRYRLWCTNEGHRAAGMHAVLRVR
jgi:hypothetical protein